MELLLENMALFPSFLTPFKQKCMVCLAEVFVADGLCCRFFPKCLFKEYCAELEVYESANMILKHKTTFERSEREPFYSLLFRGKNSQWDCHALSKSLGYFLTFLGLR